MHTDRTDHLIAIGEPCVLITTSEYETLKQAQAENIELRKQIALMTGTMATLNETISRNNTELDILRRENTELRATVAKLMQQVISLETRLDMKNYRMLLQDINTTYKLETILAHPHNKKLADLRKARNTEFHIFDTTDTQDIVNYKTSLAINKLKQMPAEIKTYLEHKCTGLTDKILQYLNTVNLTANLSDDDKEDIEHEFNGLF